MSKHPGLPTQRKSSQKITQLPKTCCTGWQVRKKVCWAAHSQFSRRMEALAPCQLPTTTVMKQHKPGGSNSTRVIWWLCRQGPETQGWPCGFLLRAELCDLTPEAPFQCWLRAVLHVILALVLVPASFPLIRWRSCGLTAHPNGVIFQVRSSVRYWRLQRTWVCAYGDILTHDSAWPHSFIFQPFSNLLLHTLQTSGAQPLPRNLCLQLHSIPVHRAPAPQHLPAPPMVALNLSLPS